jgi:hypothetical protein
VGRERDHANDGQLLDSPGSAIKHSCRRSLGCQPSAIADGGTASRRMPGQHHQSSGGQKAPAPVGALPPKVAPLGPPAGSRSRAALQADAALRFVFHRPIYLKSKRKAAIH